MVSRINDQNGRSGDEGPTMEALRRELSDDQSTDSPESDGGTTGFRDARSHPQRVMATTLQQLFPDTDVRFSEGLIKENLSTVLAALVQAREEDTHGKALMGELDALFKTRLSPGTVYPELHELADGDALSVHERVRTKEYRIADDEAVRRQLEDTMREHLALGLFLRNLLELEENP